MWHGPCTRPSKSCSSLIDSLRIVTTLSERTSRHTLRVAVPIGSFFTLGVTTPRRRSRCRCRTACYSPNTDGWRSGRSGTWRRSSAASTRSTGSGRRCSSRTSSDTRLLSFLRTARLSDRPSPRAGVAGIDPLSTSLSGGARELFPRDRDRHVRQGYTCAVTAYISAHF